MSMWTLQVRDELVELKAQGLEFDEAWTRARRKFPPRGIRPQLGDEVEFFKRVCEDAWLDRKPELRAFGGLRDLV
jgi:hypothetical protein